MEKLLSVAIPCYNAAWCLDKCLASYLASPISEQLELILINDGSTDETLEIMQRYQAEHPGIIRIIDKENGGHGSGINAAIEIATGKFFNACDSDDWAINLHEFLEILKTTDADAIITHFHTIDMLSGEQREYKTLDIPLGKVYTLDEFTSYPGDIYPCTVFHGLTYRTSVYRESGAKLSEGIFYEDQEFATFPFSKVKTVLPLDLFFNQYLIGNVNQSMADHNHVKRLSHVEQVVRGIFHYYHNNPGISEGARRYIARKATDLLFNYYVVALLKNPEKKKGREDAARFREEMMAVEPRLVELVDSKYRLTVLMSRLRVSGKTLEKMKQPKLYYIYRKLLKRN